MYQNLNEKIASLRSILICSMRNRNTNSTSALVSRSAVDTFKLDLIYLTGKSDSMSTPKKWSWHNYLSLGGKKQNEKKNSPLEHFKFFNDLLISQWNPAVPHSQVDTQTFTIMYNKTLSRISSLLINTHDRKKTKIKTSVCAPQLTEELSCIKEMIAPVDQFPDNFKRFPWRFNLIQPCHLAPLHPCTDLETQKNMWFYLQSNTPCAFIVPVVTYMTDDRSTTGQRQKAQQSSKSQSCWKNKSELLQIQVLIMSLMFTVFEWFRNFTRVNQITT